MKKHILGFAFFALIVASFVFVYAFFSAPSLPPKEAVKPPVAMTETRVEKPYFCRYKSNKLSYEVISSQFIASENKLVSKIKVSWNGYAEAPNKVYLTSLFTAVKNNQKETFGSVEILDQPFKNSNEKIVTLKTSASGNTKITEKSNLYARFSLNDNLSKDKTNDESSLSEPQQVLFIHE